MEFKKNDICQVTIEDIGTDGEGIGKIDGFTLFVKDAVLGDEVEVKINGEKVVTLDTTDYDGLNSESTYLFGFCGLLLRHRIRGDPLQSGSDRRAAGGTCGGGAGRGAGGADGGERGAAC